VAQAQVALHRLAPQVQHTVFQPYRLGKILFVELERRRRGDVEDLDLVRNNFNLAGR
jgi:hypothetical protein